MQCQESHSCPASSWIPFNAAFQICVSTATICLKWQIRYPKPICGRQSPLAQEYCALSSRLFPRPQTTSPTYGCLTVQDIYASPRDDTKVPRLSAISAYCKGRLPSLDSLGLSTSIPKTILSWCVLSDSSRALTQRVCIGCLAARTALFRSSKTGHVTALSSALPALKPALIPRETQKPWADLRIAGSGLPQRMVGAAAVGS